MLEDEGDPPAAPGRRWAAAPALRLGDAGPGVFDLQSRLRAAGYEIADPAGQFGDSTEQAVRAFQLGRHLPADGVCGADTWSAVIEAGYHLGDRLLYHRRPMLRGDDVAILQQRLSALGFDPGRIDGIFGGETVTALTEFQRNDGLPGDGICGPATVAELVRLSLREGGSDPVSPLREQLTVTARGASESLAGQRVAVGEPGGFPSGVSAISRALREAGSTVLEMHHPDASRQAAEANSADVTCVLHFRLDPETTACSSAYYQGFRYVSPASKRLAKLMQATLPEALDLANGGIEGMALPILRETRMPAIEVRLGAPVIVVQRTPALARAVIEVLTSWLTTSSE